MVDLRKEFISYDHYGKLLDALVQKLIPYRDRFHSVYGIPRGGLNIAVHLSHHLELDFVKTIEKTELKDNNKVLLLVDDLVDTAKTLMQYQLIKNDIPFQSAVLFYKPHSIIKPDFYVKETSTWIVFPYEKVDEVPNREAYESLGTQMSLADNETNISRTI